MANLTSILGTPSLNSAGSMEINNPGMLVDATGYLLRSSPFALTVMLNMNRSDLYSGNRPKASLAQRVTSLLANIPVVLMKGVLKSVMTCL